MKCVTADNNAPATPLTCCSQRNVVQVILLCINNYYSLNIFDLTSVAWGSFQHSLEKLCQLLYSLLAPMITEIKVEPVLPVNNTAVQLLVLRHRPAQVSTLKQVELMCS